MKIHARAAALAVLALSFTLTGCDSQSQTQEVELTRVIDGDTFITQIDGDRVNVRILGIDTPEMHSGSSSVPECGATEARDHLYELLTQAERIELVTDPHADLKDRYGRALRHVNIDGHDVGLEMIRSGYASAWVPSGEPDPAGQDDYTQAWAHATKTKTGMNAHCAKLGRG